VPGPTLVVSDRLRLAFCVVGKAACTSWLRALLQLTGHPAARLVAATDRTSVHTMFRFYLDAVPFPDAAHVRHFQCSLAVETSSSADAEIARHARANGKMRTCGDAGVQFRVSRVRV